MSYTTNIKTNDAVRQHILTLLYEDVEEGNVYLVLSNNTREDFTTNVNNRDTIENSVGGPGVEGIEEVDSVLVENEHLFKALRKLPGIGKPEDTDIRVVSGKEYYIHKDTFKITEEDTVWNAVYGRIPMPTQANGEGKYYNTISLIYRNEYEMKTFIITQSKLSVETPLPLAEEEPRQPLKLLLQL